MQIVANPEQIFYCKAVAFTTAKLQYIIISVAHCCVQKAMRLACSHI